MSGDDDDAYFPKPRAKGGYREPADVPRVHELEEAEPPKRAVVVTRADAPAEAERRVRVEDQAQESLRTVLRKERGFWERQSTFRNHPRKCGGVLVVVGALLTFGELQTLMHGGFSTRAAFFGPVALASGIFPLAFGMPVDKDGVPPSFWKTGFGVMIGLGLVGGLVMIALAR